MAGLSGDVAAAYEGVAAAWEAGPARMYDRLASAVVDAYPAPLADQHVLDVGAGTGAVSRVLLERGARPAAVDSARDMVAHMRGCGIDAVAGDLCALPFESAHFDGAVAAFSVSHTDQPVQALAEMRRVVRAGGAVVVGVFAAQPPNPAKEAPDRVAERFGYVPPAWYARLKRELEPLTDTPERLRSCAERAGLVDIDVLERTVDAGASTPAAIVAVRAGMANLAPFVDSLSLQRRRDFVAAAEAEVARNLQPLRPAVLILRARVSA